MRPYRAMTQSLHAHVRHDTSTLAQAAADVLTGAGEQWTEMRSEVFDLLAGKRKPASAYDIADQLGKKRGRRIAPNSIYRILDLFVAHNLAFRVESRNAFLVNDHPGCVHDCVFLVCDKCGITVHLDNDEIGKMLRKAALGHGFEVIRPVIEARGLCKECAKL